VDKPIELIPLVCLQCSTPVPAEIEEVAWVCGQCGQGMYLHKGEELVPMQVNFSKGKPFWVAEGQVSLRRETYGSSRNGEAEAFWSQPRRFFVPAYSGTLEELLSKGLSLLMQPPELHPGPTVRFEPVTLSQEDVLPAAEFVVVAAEAGRKDRLKKLDFELKFQAAPVLWILP
jgi:hypothetical protein